MRKRTKRLIKSTFIMVLAASWLLAGWPGVWLPTKNGGIRFPTKITEVHAGSQAYTSGSGNFTPSFTGSYTITLVGGGGAGGAGGGTNKYGGGGGGGGGLMQKTVSLTSGQNYAYSVGTAGTGGTGNGGGGGNTTFVVGATTYTASGGGGGLSYTNGRTGGSGGTGTNGDLNYTGGTGATGSTTYSGGGGGGAGTTGNGNNGTTSTGGAAKTNYGGAGGNGSTANAGAGGVGSAYGGAGGGSTKGTNGANGYAGYVIITWTDPITTLADGTNPSNTSIGPGASITDLDAFTLINDTTTDTINSLTVTLAPTGAYNNIDTVTISDNSNNSKCTANSLSSDTVNFTSCGLSVTTGSATTYKVRVTPKSHANMPSPPGASYDTTGTVTSITSANSYSVAGTDGASATVTIDNASPNGATTTSGTAGDTAVTLNWTSSNSSDFNTTSGSVVYRWAAASAGSEVPTEGSTPTLGGTNGTATIACLVSSNASTALSKIDGTGGSADCTTTALTNGQAYTYKVFQKDTNGNYDVGVSIGTFTPQASGPPSCSSTASGNWSAVGTWGSGCSGANGQPIAGDVATISAGNNVTVDGSQAALSLTVSNTGTLTFGASSTLTLSAITGTVLTNNGSISGGSSSTMVFNGATAPTALLGGTGGFTGSNSFNNLTLSPTITGAVGYSMGAAFSATGNFTVNPTSSASNTLTVTLSGTTSVTGLTDLKGTTSATSVLDTGSNQSLTTGTINIEAGGTLTANGSTVTINGTTGPLFTRTGTFNVGSSTVNFSQTTSDLTINTGTVTFNNLGISMSGKTGTLGNAITVNGNLSVSAGTLADGGYQITGNATGALTVSSGTTLKLGSSTATTFPTSFTNGNTTLTGSTVEYTSTVAQNVSATPTYGNLTISGASTKTLQGTTTVGATVTIGSGATLSTSGSNYNMSVAGNWTNNGGTFTPGTGTVTFNGTGAQAINGSASSQTFYGLTLTKTAGTTLSVSGSTTTLAVTNFTETTGNFTAPATMDINGNTTLTAGTYTAGTNTTVFGNWTNNGGTFTPGTNTVTFDGTGAQAINGSAASQTFYNLVVGKTAGTTLTVSGSTTTLNATNLTQTTGNFTAPATTNISGSITLSAGTYTAGSNTNLAGNFVGSGGTFAANAGTVTLNGGDSTTQAISGSNTFNNLIATTTSNTAGRTIQYESGSTTTVSGTWTMNGASGKILSLTPSSTTNWTVSPTGNSVTYVYLSRSTNTVGTVCATYSSGDGNNSGYFISSDGSCTNSAPGIPTLDSPTDTSTNQSVTPALKTTTTDANGDYVQYKIILCENSAMTTNCQTFDQSASQTGWSGQNANGNTAYTSGTQGTYTVQTALQNSFTYYWKSSAIDPTPGSNTWGGTQTTPYSFTTQAAGGGDLVPHFNGNTRIFGNTIIK